MDISARLQKWRQARNFVAIGNLGEHVTGRLLIAGDYQLLGCQDDFMGMVSDVLDIPTLANPEDFIAADPGGRLVTVNSKASVSERACRITRTGDLSKPRLARVKVDLVHRYAQIFEIGLDGHLTPCARPIDVCEFVDDVLSAYPDHIPPPHLSDFL